MQKETDPTKIAISKCICRACPSYSLDEIKKAFCHLGKSDVIKADKGCICAGCPAKKEMNLGFSSYCIKGTERERSKV
jgi:hypothetical protein